MTKLLTPLVILAMSTILSACEAPAPDAKAPRPIRSPRGSNAALSASESLSRFGWRLGSSQGRTGRGA